MVCYYCYFRICWEFSKKFMNVNSELCSPNNNHNNNFSTQYSTVAPFLGLQHMFDDGVIQEDLGSLEA